MRWFSGFLLKERVLKGLTIVLLALALIFVPVLTNTGGTGSGSAEAAVSNTYIVTAVPADGGEGTAPLQQGEDWFWETIILIVVFVGIGVAKSVIKDKPLREVFKVNAADNLIGIKVTIDDIEMESGIGGQGPLDPSQSSQLVIKDTLEGALRFDNPTGQPQVVQIGGGSSEVCFDLQAQASVDEKAGASFDFTLSSPEDGTLFTKSVEVKAENGSADDPEQDCVPVPQTNMTIPAGSSKTLEATLVNQGFGQSGPVGGTTELLVGDSGAPSENAGSSGDSTLPIAAAAGGVLIALAGGGLFMRRRLLG